MKDLKIIKISILIIGFLIISSCSKNKNDSDEWDSCYNCAIDSWIGSYEGSATYFNAENNTNTEGLKITIEVSETGTNYLTISVQIPNYFTTTISGELTSGYYLSFAGSSNSLSASLFENNGQLKMEGTSKKFHYKVNELVIERVINFEALKAKS